MKNKVMKKTYNTPEILICSMDSADVIATSNIMSYGGGNSGEGKPVVAEGNERGNAIWDD